MKGILEGRETGRIHVPPGTVCRQVLEPEEDAYYLGSGAMFVVRAEEEGAGRADTALGEHYAAV
jgi:hypothetical protein